MSQPANHPPQSELLEFGLGKLPPDDSQRIEQHLEACPDCSQTVLVLQDDTFVGLVRTSKGKAPATVNADATIDVGVGAAPRNAAAELPTELRNHSRYEILGLIGRGGMGDVYQAQHRVMNRLVALKVIKPELVQNEAAVQRFRREVQAAARLHDRNIVTAYDAEQAGSLHFLVMEYVEGVNLDEVVRRRGPLPVAEACDAIRQAAKGLQHAHELGMVHRDIKPHNLMLTPAGDVKILDFGLAGIASELSAEEVASETESRPPRIANSQLTQAGSMMGTPDYIAPEQATDAHAADIRADIYSLGCTFYTLLAGRPPFDPGSVFDKIKAHAEETPRALAEYRADVPAEVEAILLKMLAKNPAERFQTPHEVIAALAQAAPAVLPKPLPAVVRQKPSRAWMVALVTVASLLTILAATIFYIQTDFGVVRVEVADDSLRVRIDGGTITAQDRDTTVIRIRPGERKLIVTSKNSFDDDFEFITDSFQLRRGDDIRLKVELLPGEIAVLKNGQLFDSGPATRPESPVVAEIRTLLSDALLVNSFDQDSPAPSNGMVPTPDGRAGWGLDCRGKSLQIPDSLIDGRKQYTLAMWVRDSGKGPDGSHKRSVYRVGEPRDGGTFYPFHLTLEGDRIWASCWQGTKWAQANSASKIVPANEWFFLAITVMTQAADRSVLRITVNDQSFLQPFAVLEKSSRKRLDLVGGIDGQIDELVALPQPLTEKQLDLLYRHGKSGLSLSQLQARNEVGGSEQPSGPKPITFVRKLTGHTGSVKSVTYSPDGTLVASASGFPHSDGTIRLWDVKQAKEVRQLKGQQGLTQSLSFSHDGKQLLAGGSDKMLRLWDVATGELLKTLAGHEGSIESVGFSPNDRIAVSGSVAAGGSTDHTARSWDLATGKEIARFTGHKLHVHGVAIIDDTRAISVDRMGVGYIWRVDNGQQLKRLAVPSNASNSAYALALSPDRAKAIIGYQDNAIRIWDVNSGELIQTLPSQNSPTMSVCMTADQRYVLAGGGAMGDKSVALEVFELASGKRLASTEPMDGTTWSIALSPDGRHVVTAGGAKWKSEEGFVPNDDYALYVWQLPESLAAVSNRILVELKDDGRFVIENREVNSIELMNRLQWILKETPEREVHVLPAKKFSGEPFHNLVSLVRSAGGKRVTWPKEVDEYLLQEMTGPELDPAVADAVNDLAAAFEKYLRNIKATSACVGEFPGNLPERIGNPLRIGVERKLREAGFEIVPATPAPKGVFELSGVSYEVQIYKKLPKLDVRYRIGRSGVGASQGGGGQITTYGRKMDASDLLGDWTETNDPQRGPVHTLKFLMSGEFHEAGPMVIGAKQWVTKDLDGDGKPDIVPFQMSGRWEWKDGELHTETTSSNVLGFKNERPGNQRRFRIETLTKDKLVLVLLENGKDADRFTAFRPSAKANSAPPENLPATSSPAKETKP